MAWRCWPGRMICLRGLITSAIPKLIQQRRSLRLILGLFVINALILGGLCYRQFALNQIEDNAIKQVEAQLQLPERLQQYDDALMLSTQNSLTRQQIEDALQVLQYSEQTEQFSKTLFEQIQALRPKDVAISGLQVQGWIVGSADVYGRQPAFSIAIHAGSAFDKLVCRM